MNNSAGVELGSMHLFDIVEQAIKIHKSYDKDSNYTLYDRWSWSKLKTERVKLYEYPSWAHPNSGTLKRLMELKVIAEGTDSHSRIFLSELTFLNLMLILKKSEDFQPAIFAMRY